MIRKLKSGDIAFTLARRMPRQVAAQPWHIRQPEKQHRLTSVPFNISKAAKELFRDDKKKPVGSESKNDSTHPQADCLPGAPLLSPRSLGFQESLTEGPGLWHAHAHILHKPGGKGGSAQTAGEN